MHQIQEKILQLADKRGIDQMTLRQIGEAVGEPNQPQKIKHHIVQLAKKGLIKIDKSSNSISKIEAGVLKNSGLLSIPIRGSANCGEATIFADDRIEGYLNLSPKILPPNLRSNLKNIFALKAFGHSMNKAVVNGNKIEDGDFIIIQKDAVIRDNDFVLSIIDGMANIKRLVKDTENNQVILMSESTQNFTPIFIHEDDFKDFIINGKVVQVIKKPRMNKENSLDS